MCPFMTWPYILVIVLIALVAYTQLTTKPIYISHSYEPTPGDMIKNNNVQCKHYMSKGKVLSVSSLPGDMGKVITYLVINDGPTYQKGMTLTKTMDQLCPM